MKSIVRLFSFVLLLSSFSLPATAAYEIGLSEGTWLNPYPKVGEISRLILDEYQGKYSIQVFIAESAQYSGDWTERELGNVLLHMRRGKRSVFFEAEVAGLFVAIRPSLVDGRMHIKVKNSRLGGPGRPIRNEFGELINKSKEYFLERQKTAARDTYANRYGTKGGGTGSSASPFQQRPSSSPEQNSPQNYSFPDPYTNQAQHSSDYLREEDSRLNSNLRPYNNSNSNLSSTQHAPRYKRPTSRPVPAQTSTSSFENLKPNTRGGYQHQTERPSLPPSVRGTSASETARGLPPRTQTRPRQTNRSVGARTPINASPKAKPVVPQEVEWSVKNERRYLVELHKKEAGGNLEFVDLIYSGETVSRTSMTGETWVLWDRHAQKTIKEVSPRYTGEQFILGKQGAKTRHIATTPKPQATPSYSQEADFEAGEVLIHVLNETSDQVNVFLKSKSGKDEFKFALKPGALKKVESMPREKWIFRSARSGKVLGGYTANKREEQSYVIDY